MVLKLKGWVLLFNMENFTNEERIEFIDQITKQKRRALFELNCDKKFLETFKGHLLNGDDKKMRARMVELNRKADTQKLSEIEEEELTRSIEKIDEIKRSRIEHRQVIKLIADIEEYLTCLKSC